MKRLVIPDREKTKGIMWVEYPVCVWEEWWSPCYIAERWELLCIAELEIYQGKN
jgi:hypothetical protein